MQPLEPEEMLRRSAESMKRRKARFEKKNARVMFQSPLIANCFSANITPGKYFCLLFEIETEVGLYRYMTESTRTFQIIPHLLGIQPPRNRLSLQWILRFLRLR